MRVINNPIQCSKTKAPRWEPNNSDVHADGQEELPDEVEGDFRSVCCAKLTL